MDKLRRMADSLLTRRHLLKTLGLSSLALTLPLGWPVSALAAAPAGRNPKTQKAAAGSRLLMIDPGHGGRDPGCIGKSGLYEKDVVLDVSRQLAEALSGIPGVQAKLTREKDIFIPLEERVEIAQGAKADFFVSIHADSAPTSSARGLSAYTLSRNASDNFAKALEHKENLADLAGGLQIKNDDPEVADILMDLAARHTKTAALKARHDIVQGLEGDWTLLDNPMRSANFAVLRAPDMPSMLIETGFLSNAQDEKILQTKANRQKIAKLLAREFGTILNAAPFV
jgi:N-acetylmuramoyl-L-alanine amidase